LFSILWLRKFGKFLQTFIVFLEFKLKIISKNFCHHIVQIHQEKNCLSHNSSEFIVLGSNSAHIISYNVIILSKLLPESRHRLGSICPGHQVVDLLRSECSDSLACPSIQKFNSSHILLLHIGHSSTSYIAICELVDIWEIVLYDIYDTKISIKCKWNEIKMKFRCGILFHKVVWWFDG
jgi:hypothetical protein